MPWCERINSHPWPSSLLILRSKPLNDPGCIFLAISQPVVKPVRTTLPELNAGWAQTIASPERRDGDASIRILNLKLLPLLLQNCPVYDHLTLPGSPGAQLTTDRTSSEITRCLCPRYLADRTRNTYLTSEFHPRKHQNSSNISNKT